jgi:hypothetical protein
MARDKRRPNLAAQWIGVSRGQGDVSRSWEKSSAELSDIYDGVSEPSSINNRFLDGLNRFRFVFFYFLLLHADFFLFLRHFLSCLLFFSACWNREAVTSETRKPRMRHIHAPFFPYVTAVYGKVSETM